MGPMGSTTELGFGWATPILSYAMACVGAALGLRCMVRALAASGPRRRNWLLMAATAIGTGIWTMHFIAMLGFSVTGTAIRYDGYLTVASLAVSIAVVGLGLRRRLRPLPQPLAGRRRADHGRRRGRDALTSA